MRVPSFPAALPRLPRLWRGLHRFAQYYGLARPVRTLFFIEGVLFLCFAGGITWLWRSLPEEGVKLHGNIDTGVDLLGTRQDLLWIAVLGAVVYLGNGALAWLVSPREHAAAVFLVASTIPVLLLLIGAVLFLARLNQVTP